MPAAEMPAVVDGSIGWYEYPESCFSSHWSPAQLADGSETPITYPFAECWAVWTPGAEGGAAAAWTRAETSARLLAPIFGSRAREGE